MFMRNLLVKIARWWRKFVKDHIIDSTDDPNF